MARADDLNSMLSRGDWAGAELVLAAMASQPGAHPSILYNYGKVLLELHRWSAAADALRSCVEALPDHANAWFELGRATLAAGDLGGALEGFARATALAPDDMDAQRNLGRVALRLGRYDVARAAWSHLGDDPEARLALYRVAAETRAPEAAALRAKLLASHPDRAAVLRTLGRVSAGAVPLRLGGGERD